MAVSKLFPSTDWFGKLAASMEEDQKTYTQLGPMDCAMIVRVLDPERGERNFEVVCEALSVTSIREVEDYSAAISEHFVIQGSLETWKEMIENIHANDGPDLEHTLNYLTFPGDPMQVSGPDQLQVDAFYRYNQSIQKFFNAASEIETTYG